ncbi:hypothetical protein LIER_33897 [Lithospermum erythrorhizon]|uniref:Uncharacterized protein n=1 Tax=Lithospermum erythrorhizon TaxID=34254 RepID=A0AAV3RYU6_LITER
MMKQEENKFNSSVSDDGVVIKVYTESTTLLHHQNTNANKIGNNSRGGYNRRAELLARVHHLRGLATSEQQNAKFPEMDNTPNLNQKKKKLPVFSMARIELCCYQCFNKPKKQQCGYEHIVTEDYEGNNIEGMRFLEPARTRSPYKRNSKIIGKLKNFLKGLSCIWHCKKY